MYVTNRRWNNSSSFSFVFLLVAILSYFINLQLKGITDNIIIHCYFNDFLATIMILSWSNILLESKYKGIYSFKYICLYTILLSIIWEYLTPLFLNRSVGDPLDVVAYFLGSFVYYLIYKIIFRSDINENQYRNRRKNNNSRSEYR